MAKIEKDPFKLVLSSHRVSYVTLKEPKAFEEGQTPKYSVTFLITKDHPDVDRIKRVFKAAYDAKKEEHFKGLPFTSPKIDSPLRDGDEYADEKAAEGKNGEAYRGCYYLKASSTSQPKVFDVDKQDVIDLDDVYSGCMCRGVINVRTYNNTTYKKRGYSTYLESVMKTGDGTPLGGGNFATADDYDEEEDNTDLDELL